jgi:quercetin dioxygenase-like cupin family protein
MDVPLNVVDVKTTFLESTATPDAAWAGGFFAHGGNGADKSALIYFSIPPGKRLGRHTDTAEETQFVLSGIGDLLLDAGPQPMKPGDLIVLKEGVFHDLHNTGAEDLRILGFFAAPKVQQHWSTETWPPDDSSVTGSPE